MSHSEKLFTVGGLDLVGNLMCLLCVCSDLF